MIEILSKDLLGRITKFKTKTGVVETPAFLPVVHPLRELISPKQMYRTFKCKAIITNAYLLFKEKEGNIHSLLDFPGTIMTDSGAYQLLVYGEIDVGPSQIIQFQERIGSDIAVILDIPTGGKSTYEQAMATVEETLKRAAESIPQRTRSDILWVAPVQGGTYPTLVAESARRISKLDFSIFAIGSPTQLLERYRFAQLVELVMTAKRNLPVDKPVHLFGAGHPIIFPLIVAMGCDMFDSAAYALFARNNRVLTSTGTYRLNEIKEEFCYCPTCVQYTVKEIKQLEQGERTRVLAEHNLYVCLQEISRIKQAIREGRLWRLVESRLSSHPSIIDAMNQFSLYKDFIEKFSPVTKSKAIFFSSEWSLHQPEVIRHQRKMASYHPPVINQDILLLMAAPITRPYHSAPEYSKVVISFKKHAPLLLSKLHIIFLSPYFGLVPIELSDIYPLAQNETPHLFPCNWVSRIIKQVSEYVLRNRCYSTFIGILPNDKDWRQISKMCSMFFRNHSKQWICVHTNFTKESLTKEIQHIIKKQYCDYLVSEN
ncbi:MAG: tRNA guanosine(15) transglycosylase TgtA [Promethearchaeota archaeon]